MLTWGRLIPMSDICFYKARSKMLQGDSGRSWEAFWRMIIHQGSCCKTRDVSGNGKDLTSSPAFPLATAGLIPNLHLSTEGKHSLQKALLWTKGTQMFCWPPGQPSPPLPAANWYLSHSRILQDHGQKIRQQEFGVFPHILQIICPIDSFFLSQFLTLWPWPT